MTRYSAALVERAQGLFKELSQLEAQNVCIERNKRIQQVEREILKLTGAPSVSAAKVGVNAYFKATTPKVTKRRNPKKAKQDLEAKARRKKVKKKAVDPLPSLPPIKIVSGGLPGTHR